MDDKIFNLPVPIFYEAAIFIVTYILIKRITKKDSCFHKNTFMYVESTAATCEKITTTCLDCGHKSTKIEC
jgi:CRISPR/Cas system CMR subunit Cmr4 (Cas7 group RAMP superfamily)